LQFLFQVVFRHTLLAITSGSARSPSSYFYFYFFVPFSQSYKYVKY